MAGPAQRYDLLRPLADGGMGEVFLAELSGEAGFRKRVALKRVKPELARDPAFVERFISEAKLAVTLSHANIVQTLDLGRLDDTLFLAMEYVEGADLARLFRAAKARAEPVPVGLVVHVAIEALRALSYAHGRIIHCDVSPSNLLISYAGEVKLTDFGVAMWASLGDRQHGTVAGKVPYMAPEMLRGEPFDARIDLYALAVVLREVLELERAFSGPPDDLRRDVLAGACRLTGRADVPAPLDALLRRAMSVRVDERPPSAVRFLAELAELAPQLGPVMPSPEVGEWVRRLIPPEPTRLDGFAQLIGNTANGTQSVAPATTSFVVRRSDDGLAELQVAAEIPPPRQPSRRRWLWAGAVTVLATAASGALWNWRSVEPKVAESSAISSLPEKPPLVPEVAQPAPVDDTKVPPEAPKALEPKPPTRPSNAIAAKKAKRPNGFLNVSSEPWATVHIDGVAHGATPLYQVALPEGRHQIVFSRAGEKPVERVVNIAAGQTQLLDLDLK